MITRKILYFVFCLFATLVAVITYHHKNKIIPIRSPFDDAMLLYWDTGKDLCIDGNKLFTHTTNKFQICTHSKKAMILFENRDTYTEYRNIYVYDDIYDVFDQYANIAPEDNDSDGDKYFQRFAKNDVIAYVKGSRHSKPTQKIKCFGECRFIWND